MSLPENIVLSVQNDRNKAAEDVIFVLTICAGTKESYPILSQRTDPLGLTVLNKKDLSKQFHWINTHFAQDHNGTLTDAEPTIQISLLNVQEVQKVLKTCKLTESKLFEELGRCKNGCYHLKPFQHDLAQTCVVSIRLLSR